MFHDVLPSDSVSKVTNLSPHCLHVSKPHVDSNCEKIHNTYSCADNLHGLAYKFIICGH